MAVAKFPTPSVHSLQFMLLNRWATTSSGRVLADTVTPSAIIFKQIRAGTATLQKRPTLDVLGFRCILLIFIFLLSLFLRLFSNVEGLFCLLLLLSEVMNKFI